VYFDAHNHLHDDWLRPHRPRVLADLVAAGVGACVVNGTCETDWPAVAELCAPLSTLNPQLSTPRLLPSYGLHPWDVGNRMPDWQRRLVAQLDADPRAGVGEIGLDRWMIDRARPDDPRLAGLRRAPLDEQIEVFRWQLALAAERDLPASVHCLDAFGALHDVLRDAIRPRRGFLLHAYSGPAEMVPAFAKLGAYFSFNGAFLDPRKERLQTVYAAIPFDRLLVETDAPAMRLTADWEEFAPFPTPEGTLANHPANVAVGYRGLAQIRGLRREDLTLAVAKNFAQLFRLV
jgi:TatD DNase family protein